MCTILCMYHLSNVYSNVYSNIIPYSGTDVSECVSSFTKCVYAFTMCVSMRCKAIDTYQILVHTLIWICVCIRKLMFVLMCAFVCTLRVCLFKYTCTCTCVCTFVYACTGEYLRMCTSVSQYVWGHTNVHILVNMYVGVCTPTNPTHGGNYTSILT